MTIQQVRGKPPRELDLLWALVRRAMEEERAGEDGPYRSVVRDIACAKRLVIGDALVALAEDIRISDLSVTINSLEKAVPGKGLTWLEWDSNIPGRAPPLAHQVLWDRSGVLIEADESGERGQIHAFSRRAVTKTQRVGVADMNPIAITFDLSEGYRPPRSIVAPASAEAVRRHLRDVRDPTPAQLEASPVASAAMDRGFGIIESPYAASLMRAAGYTEAAPWHRQEPDLFSAAVDEVLPEVFLALCVFIVLRTTRVTAIEVRSTPRQRGDRPKPGDIPLGYGIFEIGKITDILGRGPEEGRQA